MSTLLNKMEQDGDWLSRLFNHQVTLWTSWGQPFIDNLLESLQVGKSKDDSHRQ